MNKENIKEIPKEEYKDYSAIVSLKGQREYNKIYFYGHTGSIAEGFVKGTTKRKNGDTWEEEYNASEIESIAIKQK